MSKIERLVAEYKAETDATVKAQIKDNAITAIKYQCDNHDYKPAWIFEDMLKGLWAGRFH